MTPRWKIAVAAVAWLPLLAACHTDPFSIKPETNATVPKKAPAADTQAQPSDLAATGSEIVCRSMKVTGTRFAKRECKTVSSWVEYDRYTNQNAKESTDNFQRLNTGCSTTGTC